MIDILGTILLVGLMFFLMRRGGGCCGGGHSQHNQHKGHSGHSGCGHGGHSNQGHEDHSNHLPENQMDTAKDPVCGMYVSKNNSISRTINGKTYYFCSERCEKEFLKNN